MVTTVMQSPHFKYFFVRGREMGPANEERAHRERAPNCKLQVGICREGRERIGSSLRRRR